MRKLVFLIAFMALVVATQQANAQQKEKQSFHKGMKALIKEKEDRKNQKQEAVPKNTRELREDVFVANSVILQTYDEFSGEWENYQRSTFTFVNETLIKEELMEGWNGEEFFVQEKSVMEYDEEWRMVETTAYEWDMFYETWLPFMQETHTYDLHGNKTLEAYYYWDDISDQWEMSHATKWDFEYNDMGNPLEVIISTWENFTLDWYAFEKETMEYDELNRLASVTYHWYDDSIGTFRPDSREEYTYNEQNEWSEVLLLYFWEEWYEEGLYTDLAWYDFSSLKLTYALAWEPGFKKMMRYAKDWMLYARITAEYHSTFHKLTYSLEEYYDHFDEVWIPSLREIGEFEQYGFITLYTLESFDEGEWYIMFGMQSLFDYNADGKPEIVTVQFYESFEQKGWINMIRVNLFYDTGVSVPELPVVANDFRVFPNPTTGRLTIAFQNASGDAIATIYSLTGQVVHNENFLLQNNQNKTLDISHLQNGLYLLEFRSGLDRTVIRIVKSQ